MLKGRPKRDLQWTPREIPGKINAEKMSDFAVVSVLGVNSQKDNEREAKLKVNTR